MDMLDIMMLYNYVVMCTAYNVLHEYYVLHILVLLTSVYVSDIMFIIVIHCMFNIYLWFGCNVHD